jgi:hypothetical protein
MGREIVYCCKCQRRILGDELDKGTAYQVGNTITCSSCALQVLETLPAKEKEALLAKMFRETKDRHAPLPKSPGATPTPRKALSPLPQPAAGPNVGLIAGLSVGALVVAVAVWMALGGNRDPVEAPKAAPTPASSEDKRRQAAAEAIRKARDFMKSRPAEVDAQAALWQDAVFAADGTPYLADAKREHEAAKQRQRESVTKDLAALEQKCAPLLEKQEFKVVLDAIEGARATRSVPEWTLELTHRAKAVEEAVGRELVHAMEAAAVAKRKGLEDDVAAARARVARWGMPKSAAEFEKALAGVALPKPLEDPALIAYWPMEEGSGKTTADVSGKIVGRIEGATWTTGKFGSALRFDGVNAYVEMPSTPELDRVQRGDYTIAAWISPESRPAPAGEPFSFVVKPGYHMGLYMSNSARFYMAQWFQEKNWRYFQTDSAKDYDAGKWYHVVGVVDWEVGVTKVFVNGAVEARNRWAPKAPTVEYGANPWRLGCALPGAKEYRQPAKAVIDDVRIYSRALSAAEVEVLFHARPATSK